MNEPLLQRLHDDLSAQARAAVGRRGASFSLGAWTSEGRQVAALVEETSVEGRLRISDAGESWSELVMGGYTDPKPSSADRRALERLCTMHGLYWDAERTEIVAVVEARDASDAIRRITSASLAIDGWRAWYPDLTNDPAKRMATVVRELVQLGPKAHWDVEPNVRLEGQKRRWTAGARLKRAHALAAVAFFSDKGPESVVERAMGFLYDVGLPLIVVANENVAEEVAGELEDAREFKGRAIAVPRLAHGTADRVFRAAESIASVA